MAAKLSTTLANLPILTGLNTDNRQLNYSLILNITNIVDAAPGVRHNPVLPLLQAV
tara:strand:- start:117 stop:284 length:168 start_codon:yes stop_codon:yes gene_type:complete